MIHVYIKRLEIAIILVLIQAFILNQIHLGGYATPYLYIWFLLKLNRSVSRNERLLWAFGMGLVIDVFSDTPGMNTAAATALAFIQPYILRACTKHGIFDDFEPSARSMGSGFYILYLLECIFLFLLLLFGLELFSTATLHIFVLNVLWSGLLSFAIIGLLEFFRNK